MLRRIRSEPMADQSPTPPKPVTSRTVQTMLLGVAVAVGLGCAIYFGWARPHLVPRNFGVVDEGRLYRSAALTPAATRIVHDRYEIKTIVDLGGYDKDPAGERVAARTAAALGIERYVFELEGDGTGNPNAYVAALRVITDPSKQPVLVHCSAGAQRTSGCVMLYRDFVQGKDLAETYPEAREYRHDPEKNPRLLPFVTEHEAAIREAFERGGSIPGSPVLPVEPRKP